jgi:sulfite reductase (ferredoxin)
VERVLRRFQEGRADGESFAAWVQRAEEGDLK